MKKSYREILITAALLTGSQILAFLFQVSHSTALILSLLTSVYYFVDLGEISPKEALTGIAGFIVSSFAVSATGKILVLNSLCKTAKSMDQTGSPMAGSINQQQVCKGFFEAWTSALSSNPVQNWYVWIISIIVGVTVAYIYRRYSGRK